MRERDLSSIHWVAEQADDKADLVLLNGYLELMSLCIVEPVIIQGIDKINHKTNINQQLDIAFSKIINVKRRTT